MHRTGSGRPVVEFCDRLRITRDVVARAEHHAWDEKLVRFNLGGAGRTQTCLLVATRQHIGRRWWWQCPDCGRRCGVLLSEGRGAPYTCRRCLRAVYLGDYASMRPYVVVRQAMGWLPGPFDHWRQIAFLVDPRRRGVRRGRRLVQRAHRLLACAPTLTEPVAPEVARYAKWFVDEATLAAADEIAARRRAVRTRRAKRASDSGERR